VIDEVVSAKLVEQVEIPASPSLVEKPLRRRGIGLEHGTPPG
jgi:hypothetical protein